MNERIKKLAAEARGQMVVLTTVDDEQWKQHEEFVETFAKLIVADCVKIIEGYCETSPEIWGLPLEILEHFDMELKDEE